MSKFGGEYKFPDELEDDKAQEVNITIEDDEVEVKVVDDTPQEDQFATPPLDENTQQELEKADESEEYTKNVKVKFKQYKKAWHDERRRYPDLGRRRRQYRLGQLEHALVFRRLPDGAPGNGRSRCDCPPGGRGVCHPAAEALASGQNPVR